MKEEKDLKKEETKSVNSKAKGKTQTATKKNNNTKSKQSTSKKKSESEAKTTKTNTDKTVSKAKDSKTQAKKIEANTNTKAKKSATNKTTAKTMSTSTDKSKANKKSKEEKETEEAVDIAFIENSENDDVDINIEDEVEISNEKLLIDQNALEEKQLETIKDAIKKNKKAKKTKANKQAKYKKILKNVLIGIVEIIYFLILIVGKATIPTIEYITALKIFIITEMIASIVIFEISYKKDKEELFLHGIEMMAIAGATLVYLHYFSMQSSILNIIGAVIIGIIIVYYLIKSIAIAVKKNKKKS